MSKWPPTTANTNPWLIVRSPEAKQRLEPRLT
jgi:hypothetical protein